MARAETPRGSGATIRHGRIVWSAGVQIGDEPLRDVRIEWGAGEAKVWLDGRKLNSRRRRLWERRLAGYGITADAVMQAAAEGRTTVAASEPRPHTIVRAEE